MWPNKKLSLWLFSSLLSALLLLVFMLLQHINSDILKLDTKWLAVASIPILIALIRSGILKKFKGFGIELELKLKDPVGELSLAATDALSDLPGDEKQSIAYLDTLSTHRKRQIERLVVKEGKSKDEFKHGAGPEGKYTAYALEEYLHRLPNLEYFEVQKNNGCFHSLIPVSAFKKNKIVDRDRLEQLVGALKEKSIETDFADKAILHSIKENDSLLEILPLIRASRYGLLPVTNETGLLKGIVKTQTVEKRIADEVLAAKNQANPTL